MLENINSFLNSINSDTLFWFCALLGSGLFAIQFVLNLFGAADQVDVEISGLEAGEFKWLSRQAVTGFFMMFGWIGLACQKDLELSGVLALVIATLAGLVSILITAFIFKIAKRLQSSGAVFRIEDTIGKEGIVYQRIPKEGSGKISVSLHDLTYEIEAISSQKIELPSFTRVQVLKKADEKTVVVVGI